MRLSLNLSCVTMQYRSFLVFPCKVNDEDGMETRKRTRKREVKLSRSISREKFHRENSQNVTRSHSRYSAAWYPMNAATTNSRELFFFFFFKLLPSVNDKIGKEDQNGSTVVDRQNIWRKKKSNNAVKIGLTPVHGAAMVALFFDFFFVKTILHLRCDRSSPPSQNIFGI